MAELLEVSTSESESESGLKFQVSSAAATRSYFTLIAELEECLDGVRTTAAFALFDRVPDFHNPGLSLKNGGTIGLPLSDRDAEAVVTASRQAGLQAHGSTDKEVDNSRGTTWELPASDFQLLNPKWEATIYSLVKQVSERLGLAVGGKIINAELQNMTLSNEGVVPSSSGGSTPLEHVFGTLVIVLPSKHEGGEIRVSHAGKTETFSTSEHSAFDSSYFARFLDVEYKSEPILSGRRLTLTYNLLCDNSGNEEPTASSAKDIQKVKTLLQAWKEKADLEELPAMAYMLEHNYDSPAEQETYMDILKGHDKQVVADLEQACRGNDIEVYVGHLERTVKGGCEADEYDYMDEWDYRSTYSSESHQITNVSEDVYILDEVVKLDKSIIANNLCFSEKFFLQAEPFMDIEPDERDFDEYQTNGYSSKNVYHRTIVLLVPRTHRAEFFFSPDRDVPHDGQDAPNLHAELRHLVKQLETEPKPEDIERFEQLCYMTNRHMSSWRSEIEKDPHSSSKRPFSNEIICDLLNASRYIDNQKIFFTLFPLSLEHITYSISSILETIGVACVRYGVDSILSQLSSELAKRSVFSEKMTILNAFKDGISLPEFKTSAGQNVRIKNWFKGEAFTALECTPLNTPEDAISVINLSCDLNLQSIFKHILPSVKENVHNTRMTIEYLSRLAERIADISQAQLSVFSRDAAMTIFKDVASDLAEIWSIELFNVSADNAINPYKRAMTNSGSYAVPQVSNVNLSLNVETENNMKIATLMWKYCEFGLTDDLAKITARLSAESGTCTIDKFEKIFIPLMKHLIDIFSWGDRGLQKQSFSTLFRNVLSSYVVRFVGPEPLLPSDWKRLPRGCGCSDCWQLDQFLLDTTQPVGHFKWPEKRRRHIQERILPWHQCMTDMNHGSPYTLTITKTLREFTEHYDWTLRCQNAQMRLNQLGLAILSELLGEIYEDVVRLNVPKLTHFVQSRKKAESVLMELGDNQNRVDRRTNRKVPAPPRDDEVVVID